MGRVPVITMQGVVMEPSSVVLGYEFAMARQ